MNRALALFLATVAIIIFVTGMVFALLKLIYDFDFVNLIVAVPYLIVAFDMAYFSGRSFERGLDLQLLRLRSLVGLVSPTQRNMEKLVRNDERRRVYDELGTPLDQRKFTQ